MGKSNSTDRNDGALSDQVKSPADEVHQSPKTHEITQNVRND
jgi:hypothetical protein